MIIGIFVDIQNDFVNGALGTPEARAIIPYIKKESHSKAYDFLIFTQDWHDVVAERYTIEMSRVPYHTRAKHPGAVIVPGLIPVGETNWRVVQKQTFGSLALPDILMNEAYNYGEDITEIHIMGLCTDICVISNALILRSAFPSVPIYVHANGCAGTTPENHESALKVMQSCLIDIYEEV